MEQLKDLVGCQDSIEDIKREYGIMGDSGRTLSPEQRESDKTPGSEDRGSSY
jgi:hypothetical protein